MSDFAFIDFSSHPANNQQRQYNIKESLSFRFLQQTLRTGRLPFTFLETVRHHYSVLSEIPEATISGQWQRVNYAIGFTIENLKALGAYKTHPIDHRQRSLNLDLPSISITDSTVATHSSHLESLWSLPTTDEGYPLPPSSSSIPSGGIVWPSEIETIHVIVKHKHEVDALLSDIQFMSDMEVIEPEKIEVILLDSKFLEATPHGDFAAMVRASTRYSIPPWYADNRFEGQKPQLITLKNAIKQTLKTHALNDAHFDRPEKYQDYDTTHLWLLDNRQQLTRELLSEDALTITNEGRYLLAIDEFDFYTPPLGGDTDDLSAIHHRFALMEELTAKLNLIGIPCDYLHFCYEESPDDRKLSGANYEFTPFGP